MTIPRILVAFAALIFVISPPALAQGPQPGMAIPQIKHVPLNRDMVASIVKSLPEMKAFSERNGLDKPPQDRGVDPITAFINYLEAKGLKPQADALVGKYGFKDVRHWNEVTMSVMIAHGFSKSGKTPEQMKAEMRSMMDQVANNPQIPL